MKQAVSKNTGTVSVKGVYTGKTEIKEAKVRKYGLQSCELFLIVNYKITRIFCGINHKVQVPIYSIFTSDYR